MYFLCHELSERVKQGDSSDESSKKCFNEQIILTLEFLSSCGYFLRVSREEKFKLANQNPFLVSFSCLMSSFCLNSLGEHFLARHCKLSLIPFVLFSFSDFCVCNDCFFEEFALLRKLFSSISDHASVHTGVEFTRRIPHEMKMSLF